MDNRSRESTGWLHLFNLRARYKERETEAALMILRGGDASEAVPDAVLRQWLQHVGRLASRISRDEPMDEVLADIQSTTAEFTTAYPEERAWDRMLGFLAARLLLASKAAEAANLVMGMQHMDVAAETLCEVSDNLQTMGASSDDADIIATLYQSLLYRKLRHDPDKRLSFLRHQRNYVIDNALDDIDRPFLGTILQLVANASAETDFDPIHDWADLEATHYVPGASWQEYETVIKNDSLWGTMPVAFRQHIVHRMALEEVELLGGKQVTGKKFEAARGLIGGLYDVYPGLPAVDEFRRIFALALFTHNHNARAHSLAHNIRHTAVMGELANDLLRKGQTVNAVRLLGEIPDADVTAMVIEYGEWPDAKDADRLRTEILTLNKYDPEWRARYIEALAVIREKEGADNAAKNLWHRASLIRQQVEKSILVYKPPKSRKY